VLYEVFMGENFCGVGDKGSGDIITVYLLMLLEVFLSMTLRSVPFFMKPFSGKKQKSQPQDYSLKCQLIMISKLQDVRLKEFCCT